MDSNPKAIFNHLSGYGFSIDERKIIKDGTANTIDAISNTVGLFYMFSPGEQTIQLTGGV